MKHLIAILTIAAAIPSAAMAQGCVRGEVQRDGSVVYPELGPRCPGDNPRARPTREQREGAERQLLGLAEAQRAAAQGPARHLSLDRCYAVLHSVPNQAAPLGPPWNPGEPSPDSPYLTPQENWCMALTRGQESVADNRYPGLLPDGWHATYLGNGRWRVGP